MMTRNQTSSFPVMPSLRFMGAVLSEKGGLTSFQAVDIN
jgi:hypothetical protein